MKRRYEAIDPNIQRWLWCAKLHGDPVTERGHRGRKLDERQEARLLESTVQQTLDAKPFTSNRDLAAAVGVSQREQ